MGNSNRVVLLTFAVGVAAAGVLVVVGALLASEGEKLAIGPELVKAGIQVGAVALIGAGVAHVLRVEEVKRQGEREAEAARRVDEREGEAAALEEKRRKDEYRARVLHDLVSAYNGVKCVRRLLRAHGFRRTASDRAMTTEDIADFSTRMESLTQSQLQFEGVAREVLARREWFADPDALVAKINSVEKYFARSIQNWEDTDGDLVIGARLSRIHSLVDLQKFVADSDEGFREGAADPMREIEDMLREDAYPRDEPTRAGPDSDP